MADYLYRCESDHEFSVRDVEAGYDKPVTCPECSAPAVQVRRIQFPQSRGEPPKTGPLPDRKRKERAERAPRPAAPRAAGPAIICPATGARVPLASLGVGGVGPGATIVHMTVGPCPACGRSHTFGNAGARGDLPIIG